MSVINITKKFVANLGDILFLNNTGKKVLVPYNEWSLESYPTDTFIALGVVAIPSSHDVYGDGSCGVLSMCSYKPSSYAVSASSSSGTSTLFPTENGTLINYTEAIHTSTDSFYYSDWDVNAVLATETSQSLNGKLTNVVSETDPKAYYPASDNTLDIIQMPSPYNGEERNSQFAVKDSILEYFNGEDIGKSFMSTYNIYISDDDWYLPSLAELAYVHARSATLLSIEQALKAYSYYIKKENFATLSGIGIISGDRFSGLFCSNTVSDSNYYLKANPYMAYASSIEARFKFFMKLKL